MDNLLDAFAAAADDAPDSLDGIERLRRGLRSRRVPSTGGGINDTIRSQIGVVAQHAESEFDRRLAELVRDNAEELYWRPSYQTHTEPDMQAFHAGFFASPIMGPDDLDGAVVRSDEAAMWLTIQAPGIVYPSHVHKAPELYHIIAGGGLWQWGGGDFVARQAGEWIEHPSGTRHAMETTDLPMLCMAAWTDDLESISVIVRN